MAVVDESGPSGRKNDSGDALNPEPGRDMDLARASAKAGTATGGIPFFIHHQFNRISTSARGAKSFVGNVQLKGTAVMPQRGDGAVRRAAAQLEEREIRDLEELLSKLNPMAEEFVPSSLSGPGNGGVPQYSDVFGQQRWNASANVDLNGRKKSGYGKEKRKTNRRTSLAQTEEMIRRTVYVSDIDHQVTEEQLAVLFTNCGQVVDCRVCGDPNSVLRFAFIEFTDEEGARVALGLSGTMLGYYPVKSDDEREMCARTIYCTNIDKKVTQAELKLFFESICGEVYRLRLLGDYHHSTRIAFVEFVLADSATAALNCSGVILGSLPIRVSPSKTPVRTRPPRHSLLLRRYSWVFIQHLDHYNLHCAFGIN